MDFEVADGKVDWKDIHDVLQSNLEDLSTPMTIIDVLRPHNGKRLTKRHAEAISATLGGRRVYIRKQYGMTSIEFGGYGIQADPDNGGSLLLTHTETNVVIDCDDIIKRNPAYFSAAQERNEQRWALMEDEQRLRRVADAINAYRTACRMIEAAIGHPYDDEQLPNPESSAMEKLVAENPKKSLTSASA